MTKISHEDVLNLVEAGYTCKDISNMLGTSRANVWRICRIYNKVLEGSTRSRADI